MRDIITVILGDEHRIFRKGLKALFSDKSHIEALKKTVQKKPQLVIMDSGMPKMDGIEANRQIRERLPRTEALILSMHAKKADIDQVLKVETKDYVLKDYDEENLIAAINTVRKTGMQGQVGLTR